MPTIDTRREEMFPKLMPAELDRLRRVIEEPFLRNHGRMVVR